MSILGKRDYHDQDFSFDYEFQFNLRLDDDFKMTILDNEEPIFDELPPQFPSKRQRTEMVKLQDSFPILQVRDDSLDSITIFEDKLFKGEAQLNSLSTLNILPQPSQELTLHIQ
jgi:hypothetical protein